MTPSKYPRKSAPKRFGSSASGAPVRNTGKFIPRPRPTDSKQPGKFGPTTSGPRPIRKYASSTGGSSSYGDKPSYGKSARPAYGSKPSFGARKFGDKPTYGSKPTYGASRPTYRKSASSSSYEGGKPAFGAARAPFRKSTSTYEGTKPPTSRSSSYDTPRATYGKSARPAYGSKPSFGARKFGSKPSYGAARPSYGAKPSYAARPTPIKLTGFARPAASMVNNPLGIEATPSDNAAQPETSWGKEAEWYNELLGSDDNYQNKVILPHLKRLMAIKEGEKVADIACGQGFFSFAFAEAGASVHGADVASELIALAEKRREDAASEKAALTRFTVARSNALDVFEDAAYSQATIVLAIQNIDDVGATFAECSRILSAGGRLHLVINHPAFRIPKGSSWGWDESTNTQYRRIDRYLTETKAKIAMHPGSDPTAMTLSFHRPLQYFVKALARKGFAVTNLEEWTSHKTSDSGYRADAENKARAEFPMFLYLEAKKVA